MTEDEAKTKWCPFVRKTTVGCIDGFVPSHNLVTFANAKDGTELRPHCIGSACMAWRHFDESGTFHVSLDGQPEEVWHWDPRRSENYAARVKVRSVKPSDNGYCGLAGKP